MGAAPLSAAVHRGLAATATFTILALLLLVRSLWARVVELELQHENGACPSAVAAVSHSALDPPAVAEAAPRRLAQRLTQKRKGRSSAPRRDSECVQIPAKPNQPQPHGLAHASLQPGSVEPFDLSAQRELYCKWYVHIGSGYHACRAFPSPDAPCKAALRAADLQPSHAALAAAVASFGQRAMLIIGDSTMLNKYIFLRFLGVRSSCVSGGGVCFLPTYGLAGCCMHPLWNKQTTRTECVRACALSNCIPHPTAGRGAE
jgi:hypothetical protein